MRESVVFEKASILCYRIFDIADEIHLETARKKLAADTRRMRLTRAGSEYLQLRNPPLTIELGKRTLELRNEQLTVDAVARMFEHGAVSIILRVPLPPGSTPESLVPLADELFDSLAVDQLSLELTNVLRRDLANALEREHLWEQSESYTVIFVEKIEGNPTAAQILERVDLARLLLGETGLMQLSSQERADLAAELLASLDGQADEDAGQAWAEEIERRARRALADPDGGLDWDTVREELRAELPRKG